MNAIQLQHFLEVSKNMAYILLNSVIIIHFPSILLLIVQKILMNVSPGSTRLIKSLFVQRGFTNVFSICWKIFADNLSLFLDVSDKKDVTVKIELFQSIWVKTRFNDDKKRLKYTSTYASICFITDFMKELLPKTIHHLNGLQHFRSVVPEFNQVFHGVYLDLLILIKSHDPNERGGSIYLLNSGNRKCQL